MKRHVMLTGEIGSGKSTALRAALDLLGLHAEGLQTYYPEQRGAQDRRLYLRAWGDAAQGEFLTQLPGLDAIYVASVFDQTGCTLLKRAREKGEVIVIDEIGRLEHGALGYHAALAQCLEGDKPMLCAIRKLKAPWADFIRTHPAVTLIEVTPENRDEVPALAAQLIRESLNA